MNWYLEFEASEIKGEDVIPTEPGLAHGFRGTFFWWIERPRAVHAT